jgi:hypothetical protein
MQTFKEFLVEGKRWNNIKKDLKRFTHSKLIQNFGVLGHLTSKAIDTAPIVRRPTTKRRRKNTHGKAVKKHP